MCETVKSNPEFFNFLPKDYIVDGNWQNIVKGRKTNVKNKTYKLKTFPKHFNNTCYVFLKDNKCMLEELAIKQNKPRWAYKPSTCCIFPLQKNEKGVFVCPNETDDDCKISEDYPGFVSCLPCHKLKKENF